LQSGGVSRDEQYLRKLTCSHPATCQGDFDVLGGAEVPISLGNKVVLVGAVNSS
jgi:hypothetical protein